MISKNELKYLRSLNLKKFRNEEKKFIAEGINCIKEGLNSRYRCSLILFTENFINENRDIRNLADQLNLRSWIVSENELNKIADSMHPQGVMAVFEIPELKKPDFRHLNKPVIYLDEISDPGNAGTIIRTCDWFGFNDIVLSKNSADVYNPKTVRSTAGSLFNVNLYPETDISDISHAVKDSGFRIVSTGMTGESINDFKWTDKLLIVFSNEANGSSLQVKEAADHSVTIPRYGNAESLNVAGAAAVILSRIRLFLR